MQVILELLYTLGIILYSYVEALVKLFIPVPKKSVQDQVVLITGGGNGIGREVALRLAEKKARIVILDVDKNAAKQTADDISGNGGTAYTYICDVSNRDDVAKTAAKIQREVGDVDMLFNNAGIAVIKPITELSESEVRRTININLIAHFWMLQEFLPSMKTRNKGHVITICSTAGCQGSALTTDYTASKFAVRGLTEAVEKEVEGEGVTGIQFTTVYPHFTNTNLVRDISDRVDVNDRFGAMLTPEHVGEAIVDAVLKNRRHIFIPHIGVLLDYLKILIPRRGLAAFQTFLDVRFSLKR